MPSLKLSEYTSLLVLLPLVLSLSLSFYGGLHITGEADEKNDFEQLEEIQEDLDSTGTNIAEDSRKEAEGLDIDTNLFFLSETVNVLTYPLKVFGDVRMIGEMVGDIFEEYVGIPSNVFQIFMDIVMLGIVFAALSAVRGWDI